MRSKLVSAFISLTFCFGAAVAAGAQSQGNPQAASAETLHDDLVLAIWAKLREGKTTEAVAHSRHLLTVDPDNALACAALIEAKVPDASTLDLGVRGLQKAGDLKRPPSMNEDEFVTMLQRVRLDLNTAAGQAYLDRGDPITARKYLKEAVALAPWSAQQTYLASRAFLEGPNPDRGAAYWLLARTVVLTRGTKDSERINQYAWEHFFQAGGSRELWSEYLKRASDAAPRLYDEAVGVNASARSSPATQRSEGATTSAPAGEVTSAQAGKPVPQAGGRSAGVATSASGAQAGNGSAQGASSAPATSTVSASTAASASSASTQTGAAGPTQSSTQPAVPVAQAQKTGSPPATVQNDQRIASEGRRPVTSTNSAPRDVPSVRSNGTKRGSDAVPDLPDQVAENVPPKFPSPTMRRPALDASAPLSLGVLIEARVASKENRVRVVYALSDMLRHLRDNDEAFVVSYGKDVGLEQDLTWNYDLLEKAMDRIDPQQGTALLDAVSFSAGHLKRIAKNPNRVLLVISDGANELEKGSPLEQASEITSSGARIYCIGVGVPGDAERSRLEQLASRTGGRATFIDDPNGFRSAAHQIASNLGIDFPE